MSKSNKIRLAIWCMVALAVVALTCTFALTSCNANAIVLRASKEANNYTINAIYNDDTKSLFATQSVDYKNTSGDILDSVSFHLYPNAFRDGAQYKPVGVLTSEKAYPNGENFGGITIKNVKVNNKEAEFHIGGNDNDILIVPIATQLFPNSRATISFEFDVNLPNIRHRLGYTNKAVNLGNFYPIACVYENGTFDLSPYSYNGDPFYTDIANYKVALTCANDFVVASTGELNSRTAQNDKTEHVFTALAVRDFAMVLSREFKVLTGSAGKTTVSYYSYNDENAEKSLETSIKSVNTFNKIFGEYPYKTLAVVETGFVHGGMEYPNLVYISDDLSSYEEYTNVIVHEIAHQWWYGVVGDNQNVDGWIDEGLAEYSCILFYENNPEYGQSRDKIISNDIKSYVLFVEVYGDLFENFDTSMTRALTDYKTEPEYTYMAYVKSVLLVDNIRNVVGDNKFMVALKNFYRDNAMQFATKDTFIFAFENASKMPLRALIESWLDGKIVITSDLVA